MHAVPVHCPFRTSTGSTWAPRPVVPCQHRAWKGSQSSFWSHNIPRLHFQLSVLFPAQLRSCQCFATLSQCLEPHNLPGRNVCATGTSFQTCCCKPFASRTSSYGTRTATAGRNAPLGNTTSHLWGTTGIPSTVQALRSSEPNHELAAELGAPVQLTAAPITALSQNLTKNRLKQMPTPLQALQFSIYKVKPQELFRHLGRSPSHFFKNKFLGVVSSLLMFICQLTCSCQDYSWFCTQRQVAAALAISAVPWTRPTTHCGHVQVLISCLEIRHQT